MDEILARERAHRYRNDLLTAVAPYLSEELTNKVQAFYGSHKALGEKLAKTQQKLVREIFNHGKALSEAGELRARLARERERRSIAINKVLDVVNQNAATRHDAEVAALREQLQRLANQLGVERDLSSLAIARLTKELAEAQAEAQAEVQRLRQRTHEIAEAADARLRPQARAAASLKSDLDFVTREIGRLDGNEETGYLGHSLACRLVATHYKLQLAEVQAPLRALANALAELRDVQNGPPLPKDTLAWDAAMSQTRDVLHLPIVQAAMKER
jgi:hypothetical protein